MKTSQLVAVSAAATILWTTASTRIEAASPTTLTVPAGSLTAFPTVVQTGTHPTLTWNISYPSIVQNFVTVGPNPGGGGGVSNTITPLQTLDVEIRVLGAGVTVSSGNGSSYSFVPTVAEVKYDTGSYTQVFYDTNTKVNPNKVVFTREVRAGKPIRFGGKYRYNNQWGPYYNSQSGTKNVRTLVNGETPPTTYPLHTAPTLESFIRPYLDSSGKVKIGPMDVIVFMELTHSDSQITDQGYDLQDMVLLVTFKSKNNNGHGNNADGVDSSNPGNAPFTDSDPNVDDENKP